MSINCTLIQVDYPINIHQKMQRWTRILTRTPLKTQYLLSKLKSTNFFLNKNSPLISFSDEYDERINVYRDMPTPSMKPLYSYKPIQPNPNTQPKAAVLMFFYEKDNAPHFLFIKRVNSGKHPAQVGFPGGMCESGENFEQCCLRETKEELFLTKEEHGVCILNELPSAETFSTQIKVKVKICL